MLTEKAGGWSLGKDRWEGSRFRCFDGSRDTLRVSQMRAGCDQRKSAKYS